MAEHDIDAVAFPRLDAEHLAALEHCAKAHRQRLHTGQRLFEPGVSDGNFYIVKAGEIAIVDESGDAPKTLRVHGPGEFVGDVAQVTGGPMLVTAVARTDSEIFEVPADGLREILNKDPNLGDTILRAFIARRRLLTESDRFTGLRVLGSRYSQDTFRVRDFLSRNQVPFTWLDLETDPHTQQLLRRLGLRAADTPVIVWGNKALLRNPTNRQLADLLGIRKPLEHVVYDLVIVGAGPAGLAAAVYGASEGLHTVVLERAGPGGQAGSSTRIENYLGFPTGITGAELAERAVIQANKFGARLPVPTRATGLSFDDGYKVVHLDSGETVVGKCLLIATGADYRRLPVEGCNSLEGCGVYYSATINEMTMCKDAEVVVVGGGNSAGQAAVFLAGQARKVYLIIRHDDLYRSMSSYLAWRIEQTPNIEVLKNTEVARMTGDGRLSAIEVVNNKTGKRWTIRTPGLFSFIGAVPRTDWLPAEVERDDKGFVRTGPTLADSPRWTARRHPLLLETTTPGVFAAGDVRSGSVKRVASAVGEGAMAVQMAHEYLREA